MGANLDIWHYISHPVSQVCYGVVAATAQAATYAGPIISDAITKMIGACCSPTSDQVPGSACDDTAPQTDARDNFCDSSNTSAQNWYNCRLLVGLPPLALLILMASRAYRIEGTKYAAESIAETTPLTTQAPQSNWKCLVKHLTSFKGKLVGMSVVVGAGAYSLVGTSITSDKALDIGMNCLNETISLPIWPHTNANTSLPARMLFCRATERSFSFWRYSAAAAMTITPIAALAIGLCCVQNAKDRLRLKMSRHASSIVNQPES